MDLPHPLPQTGNVLVFGFPRIAEPISLGAVSRRLHLISPSKERWIQIHQVYRAAFHGGHHVETIAVDYGVDHFFGILSSASSSMIRFRSMPVWVLTYVHAASA